MGRPGRPDLAGAMIAGRRAPLASSQSMHTWPRPLPAHTPDVVAQAVGERRTTTLVGRSSTCSSNATPGVRCVQSMQIELVDSLPTPWHATAVSAIANCDSPREVDD
eukprot:3960062-Prymnesium_polylepis.2